MIILDSNLALYPQSNDISSTKILISLTEARRYDEIAARIDKAEINGATNITAGLKRAYKILAGTTGEWQVVLLSDGHHNTGSYPDAISDRLRKRAVIDCVGIGGNRHDVDEGLLKYIASEYPDGSKRYRWIGDKERLVKHFHNLAGRITKK